MNIDELNTNIQAYEEAVVLSSEGNAGLTISTVQTLITLYQKAVEYYSAMDDSSYLDVRNRMQSLLQRPDVEALMASAQDSAAQQQNTGNDASTEESKAANGSPAKDPAAAQSAFKIDDDDDDEYELEDDEGQDEGQ